MSTGQGGEDQLGPGTTEVAPHLVRRWIVAVVVVLAGYNALVNEVLPSAFDGVAAVVTAGLLWWVAARAGLDAAALGLARDRVRSGLVWGGSVSALVVAVIAVLGVVPATRSNFEDDAIGALEVSSLVWETAVRIPAVTAGFEEFAFRGVLFGLLVLTMSVRRAAIVQAVLFGLWHVLPTHGPDSSWGEVAVAVGFTAAAGIGFAFLQWRSRSLLAPWLVHTATNSATMLTAWLVS